MLRQMLRAWDVRAVGRFTHDEEDYRWTAIRCGSVFQWRYIDYGQGPVIIPFRWSGMSRRSIRIPSRQGRSTVHPSVKTGSIASVPATWLARGEERCDTGRRPGARTKPTGQDSKNG
jgi:hypothetical protein